MQIHHVLQDRYASVSGVRWCQPGLGDFIRGSAFLWQWCRANGRCSVRVCFKGHPTLKHLLQCDRNCDGQHGDVPLIQYGEDVTSETVPSFLREKAAADHAKVLLCTNMIHEPITPQCRAFLRSALQPTALLHAAIRQVLDGCERGSFDVLHVRCSDNDGLSAEQRARLHAFITERVTRPTRRVIVMSNSTALRADLSRAYRLLCRESRVNHVGLASDQQTDDALAGALDTMVDFFVMGHAAKIWQASVYWWGSNFSEAASHVFDVPLENFSLC